MTKGQPAPKADVERTTGSIPVTGAIATHVSVLEGRDGWYLCDQFGDAFDGPHAYEAAKAHLHEIERADYEASQQESEMTNPTTVFDRALEQFKRDMRWSPQATETEKTLVLGNLNGFTALLNKMLLETSDAEILAAVPPEDLEAAKRIRDDVLRRSIANAEQSTS